MRRAVAEMEARLGPLEVFFSRRKGARRSSCCSSPPSTAAPGRGGRSSPRACPRRTPPLPAHRCRAPRTSWSRRGRAARRSWACIGGSYRASGRQRGPKRLGLLARARPFDSLDEARSCCRRRHDRMARRTPRRRSRPGRCGRSAMTSGRLADWQAQARRELKGRDPESLTWETPEGIAVRPLYTEEDLAGLGHLGSLPGLAPYTRGPRATMYAGRPWTIRQYAGFSTAEELQRLLPQGAGGGAAGGERRLRSRHAPRLRQRPPAGGGRRGQGRRGDRLGRGHEGALRRHSAREGQRVDDDERGGDPGAGDLHRRGRGAGGAAGGALGDDPERHPQGVHGPQHLHLSARAQHADRLGHHRLHGAGDAEVQLDLDLRLPHAGGRGEPGAGARLHAGGRQGVREGGDRLAAWTWTISPGGSPSSSPSA